MKLIADSGSTKTAWGLIDQTKILYFETEGINPIIMSPELIEERFESVFSRFPIEQPKRLHIHFYGAGCTPSKAKEMESMLEEVWGYRSNVQSDIVGAARAALGSSSGIVAILGTGSNSCIFDGQTILRQTPPLGYILGDEGSGAVLGKLVIADLLKGRFPKELEASFFRDHEIRSEQILHRIYQCDTPSAFLASFVPWIERNRATPVIGQIIHTNFRNFMERCILPYQSEEKKINFVGSIAHFFQSELEMIVEEFGYKVSSVLRAPLEGLVKYHQQ